MKFKVGDKVIVNHKSDIFDKRRRIGIITDTAGIRYLSFPLSVLWENEDESFSGYTHDDFDLVMDPNDILKDML